MHRLRLICSLCLLGLVAACSGEKPTEPPATPTNPGLAATIVDSANDSLSSVMRTVLDSIVRYGDSTFRPSDVDFTGANAMYERAVAADPTSLDAQFGAGFTELLVFFADPQINALYERVKRMYDTTLGNTNWQLPVRAIVVPGGLFGPDFLPTGFPLSPRGVPGLVPDLPRLDHALQVSAAADPQPSDLQAILETRLLPRVAEARNRLLIVVTNRNYVFWITPEMQGNPGADSVELDMTEIRLALATLYGLEAAIHVATARHLDVSAYSIDGLSEALNVGSNFLTLKSNGAAKMTAAKTSLLATLTQADSALTFLLNESDVDQSNDLIAQGNDAAEILDSVRSARAYLTGVRTVEFENQGYFLTTNVDAAKFFDEPMVDPKTYLPEYAISFFKDSSYKELEAMYFSVQAYWDSLYSKFGVTYPNDTLVYVEHLPDQKTEDYYRIVGSCQCVWGWPDVYSWYPDNECFNYYSWVQSNYQSAWWNRNGLRVCLTWTATSFSNWTFPDPTLNGVFPNLSNSQLKDFVYPGGAFDWEGELCGDFEL